MFTEIQITYALLVSHNGAEPIEYKHKIEPVKHGDKFLPNNKALKDVRAQSTFFIENHVFERVQREGKTIIVNFAGGWCFLTKDSKIVNQN